MERLKLPVHVELEILPSCLLSIPEIITFVKSILSKECPIFSNGSLEIKSLQEITKSIVICDLLPGQNISYWQADLFIHPYRLLDSEVEHDYLDDNEEGGGGGGGESGSLPIAEQLELPNRLLSGLWESIIIDELSIKTHLLSFACTSLLFAEVDINPTLINWNKMLLLYGPPGTGKTSLCKALAQKVFIRNSHRYSSGGLLFEINCHSLFSKWFSESGKLVMKLFHHLNEIAEDENAFIVLLIDEVESIASARNSSNRSNEPGDAIRVVNAVLTSLDTLKRRKNILVLCTSNMMTSLDEVIMSIIPLSPPLLFTSHSLPSLGFP